jgi:hypothetical protein
MERWREFGWARETMGSSLIIYDRKINVHLKALRSLQSINTNIIIKTETEKRR